MKNIAFTLKKIKRNVRQQKWNLVYIFGLPIYADICHVFEKSGKYWDKKQAFFALLRIHSTTILKLSHYLPLSAITCQYMPIYLKIWDKILVD